MKIRTDFVTNSSSTSYVIMNNGEFSLEKFLNAVGIKYESEFAYIYKVLFEALDSGMKPIREHFEEVKSHYSYLNFEDYLENHFHGGEELKEKVLNAEKEGFDVFVGKLASDNTMIEGYFCVSDFEIKTKDLYVYARDDAW